MDGSEVRSPERERVRRRRFALAAWGFVAFTVPVIVWGAWVRISGSGAGCGSHWPSCHGAVIPTAPGSKTVIELVHRTTSGLVVLFAVALAVWAVRVFPRGDRARSGAIGAAAFALAEAGLGAGLVLFGLVEKDDSVARAVVIALHLVNTFCLLGFGAVAAHAAGMGGPELRWRAAGGWRFVLLAALGGALVTSMAGAVTALGDTLFPVDVTRDGSWVETVTGDLPAGTHFLVRLRVVHPLLALAVGLYLVVAAGRLAAAAPAPGVRRLALAVIALVLAQLAAGLVTVLLAAPGWAQLLHLALADGLWVALVVLTVATLAAPWPARVAAGAAAPPAERPAAA